MSTRPEMDTDAAPPVELDEVMLAKRRLIELAIDHETDHMATVRQNPLLSVAASFAAGVAMSQTSVGRGLARFGTAWGMRRAAGSILSHFFH